MVDYLELAKKRLLLLERAWLVMMTFGVLIALETGVFGPSATQTLFTQPKALVLFSIIGLLAMPYLIAKTLPYWNLLSPIADHPRIWETDGVMLIVTILGLTITTRTLFHLDYPDAIKLVLIIALLCSPLLYLTAVNRRRVHQLETPKMKGYVNPQTKLELDEQKFRFKNNFQAYILAGLAGTVVQTLSLSICLVLMDKGAVFSFFSSLVIISLMINICVAPVLIKMCHGVSWLTKLEPSSRYFLTTTGISIGPLIIQQLCSFARASFTDPAQILDNQVISLSMLVVLSTFITGFLFGSLVFGKRYMTRPASLDFV